MMDSVSTLMTVTPLPQDEEENENGKLRCAESVFSNQQHSYICTCLWLLVLTRSDQTATNFNVDTHCKLFQQTFKNIQFEKVSNFAMAQVANSAPLNPKVARMLGIKHIACCWMQRYGETLCQTERHCQHDLRGAPQGQSKQLCCFARYVVIFILSYLL